MLALEMIDIDDFSLYPNLMDDLRDRSYQVRTSHLGPLYLVGIDSIDRKALRNLAVPRLQLLDLQNQPDRAGQTIFDSVDGICVMCSMGVDRAVIGTTGMIKLLKERIH